MATMASETSFSQPLSQSYNVTTINLRLPLLPSILLHPIHIPLQFIPLFFSQPPLNIFTLFTLRYLFTSIYEGFRGLIRGDEGVRAEVGVPAVDCTGEAGKR
jgi:hypothetical protein